MHYPKAYIDYLVYFHAARDYFECHEVLEEYWKEHPDDPYKDVWHSCIQLAVTAYHERRGNINGARKMLSQACDRMEAIEEALLEKMGLDAEKLRKMIMLWQDHLAQAAHIQAEGGNYTFQDPVLPIKDNSLLQVCKAEADRHGLTWLAPSSIQDATLVHKHTLRDRSEVIQARQTAWQRKKQTSERSRR